MNKECFATELTSILERRRNPVSAWDKGVAAYKEEMLSHFLDDCLPYIEIPTNTQEALTVLLNGADNWSHYSYIGNALVYDYDIAVRLCTPSELKRTEFGNKQPNRYETWLDVQARALSQAGGQLSRAISRAYRDLLKKEAINEQVLRSVS